MAEILAVAVVVVAVVVVVEFVTPPSRSRFVNCDTDAWSDDLLSSFVEAINVTSYR